MPVDTTAIQADEGALRAMLERAGVEGWKGRACKCPFHDDAHASAGIYEKDGAWRFKCHVCGINGDLLDIQARVEGKGLGSILKELDQGKPPPPRMKYQTKPPPMFSLAELTAKYGLVNEKVCVYTNPDTKVADMIVIRIDAHDGKSFRQCRPEGDKFVMKAPEKPWPIYNRARTRKAKRVVVVEGEKCVHALHSIGIVATTSPGGAKNAKNADWSLLAGKTVVIWPDNDGPGLEYAASVKAMLEALPNPPTITQIDPASTGLGPKGDAVDFLDTLLDLPKNIRKQTVEEVLASAEHFGAGAEWHQIWGDTLAGRRRSLPWGINHITKLTQALLPGTVTLLCGAGGASKSFMVIQAARYWYDNGIPAAIYELEGERAEHLQRAAAQMANESRLLDSEWAESNPDRIRAVESEYADYMAKFGECLTAAPDEPPTLMEIASWVKAEAEAGAEIIVVDPITAVAPSDKVWIADAEFILAVKATIRTTKARLVLVMHPKKGHKGSGLDELAGGAVYGRLANTALWLDRHEPPLMVDVMTPCGIRNFGVNRTISILKARHGRGTGHKIAMTFDPQSLSYHEHGVVQPKTKLAKPEEEQRERRDFD